MGFGSRRRIQSADHDVHDHLVVGRQVFLLEPSHVQVCARYPSLPEVEILFDAVPFLRVQLAGREETDARALRNPEIGNDEPRVVLGHILVYGIWYKAKVAIEKEDDEECEEGRSAELGDSSDLQPAARCEQEY